MTDQMSKPPARGNQMSLAVLGGIALGIFLVGGAIGYFLHGTPKQVARISFYKDWRVACPADDDAKSNCALATDISDPKSGTRLAQLTWGVEAGKPQNHVIVVNVPLTVLIEPGLGLQIGSDTQTFKYATCLQNGCVATIPVTDKLIQQLDGASSVGLVVTAESGRSFTLPVSVNGYKDALAAMNATESHRKSWW